MISHGKKRQKLLAKAAKNIIKDTSPTEWIGFLFDLQNNSIANGELATYSEAAARDFSYKLSSLKNFFERLDKVELPR